jgi:hypothetical protein
MLAVLSSRYPEIVLDLLLARLRRARERAAGSEYRPIPFRWREKPILRFGEANYRQAAVTRLIDEARDIVEKSDGGDYWISALFAAVVGRYDQEVCDTLATYLAATDVHGITAIGQLVSAAERGFVFRNIGLVDALLRRAGEFGRRHRQHIRFALRQSATSGVKSGTPGEQFPADVKLKELSEQALQVVRPGSPAYELFTSLREEARAEIERAHLEGELLDDEERLALG